MLNYQTDLPLKLRKLVTRSHESNLYIIIYLLTLFFFSVTRSRCSLAATRDSNLIEVQPKTAFFPCLYQVRRCLFDCFSELYSYYLSDCYYLINITPFAEGHAKPHDSWQSDAMYLWSVRISPSLQRCFRWCIRELSFFFLFFFCGNLFKCLILESRKKIKSPPFSPVSLFSLLTRFQAKKKKIKKIRDSIFEGI